jgi:hypothetical protein
LGDTQSPSVVDGEEITHSSQEEVVECPMPNIQDVCDPDAFKGIFQAPELIFHGLPSPEEIKEYPNTLEKEYLRMYYTHNLSISVPKCIPLELLNFIVYYIEEGFVVDDVVEVLDGIQQLCAAKV